MIILNYLCKTISSVIFSAFSQIYFVFCFIIFKLLNNFLNLSWKHLIRIQTAIFCCFYLWTINLGPLKLLHGFCWVTQVNSATKPQWRLPNSFEF